ncbi:helix-turn-helix domain-containing protein [Parabacteroides distasonis]|uniref:helix-turn-helix domain-containing protein n=1 Tax=Parabacteroides distasonis TaxID=823 RepID=UPI00321BD3D6
MIIGERLKGFLKQHNFTAKQFAQMAGVSEGMVYKYYKMDNIDSDTISKWADVLHVPVLTFLDDDMYKQIVVPKTPEEMQKIHEEHVKRIVDHEAFEKFKKDDSTHAVPYEFVKSLIEERKRHDEMNAELIRQNGSLIRLLEEKEKTFVQTEVAKCAVKSEFGLQE